MPKVFATVPGAAVDISGEGFRGTATNDRPCVVPEAVAAELAAVEGLRVEPDEPVAPSKAKAKTQAPPADAPKE